MPAPTTSPAPLLGLLPAAGVSFSAFLLFALMVGWPGHVVLALSLAAAYLIHRPLFRDLLLIGTGITIVSTTTSFVPGKSSTSASLASPSKIE